MNTPMEPSDSICFECFFAVPPESPFHDLHPGNGPVWLALDRLARGLDQRIQVCRDSWPLPASFHVDRWRNREGYDETVLSTVAGLFVTDDITCPEFNLVIGKGTVIEPGVVIKPPLVVGRNTEIRQGAYIRGGVWIGDHCTVGHATEVKTAVFMNHTEAGHFAYVGDSILGSYVNLGAGSKLANLPFRTQEQKRLMAFPEFSVRLANQVVPTGKSKLGAILGDGVEIGCNSTLAPGTLVGKDSWIYPCLFVRSGYYPDRSILKLHAATDLHQRR
ncbi:hypothetical protein JXA80_13460 [bacterium]|nr:hypothetical protein [candidate division CSSED10-310 bacterium]